VGEPGPERVVAPVGSRYTPPTMSNSTTRTPGSSIGIDRDRRSRWFVVVALGVLAAGLGLRLMGLGWDEYTGLNPDERWGVMVVAEMGLPGAQPHGPAAAAAAARGDDGYFATSGSALNPRNTGRKWVWGDLPAMLATVVLHLEHVSGFSRELAAARQLTAVVDSLTIVLVIALALDAGLDERAALVAGILYAVTPLALQHAHFFVVDVYATCAGTAALAAACRIVRRGRWGSALAGGAAVGAAVACKASMVLVAVPVGLAALAARPREASAATGRRLRWRPVLLTVAAAAASLLTFRLVHPYAFSGPGLFDIGIDTRWWHDLTSAAAQQRASFDAPWAWQWIGRAPTYLLGNLAQWALGPPLAVAAAAGVVWAGFRGLRRGAPALLVPAGWVVLVVVLVSLQTVKSIRYVLPAVPAMAVVAAGMLIELAAAGSRFRRAVGATAAAVVMVATAGFGFAVVELHLGEHPRLAASRWIMDHVPEGATIANESRFDDALPWTALYNGAYRNGFIEGRFHDVRLGMDLPDSPAKLDRMVSAMASANWLVVSSDRMRAPMSRLPERFPLTAAYYEMLFDGKLGYALAATFEHRPRWFGLMEMDDSRAEEAWRVNDHPTVWVFRRTAAFDASALVRALTPAALAAVHTPGTETR